MFGFGRLLAVSRSRLLALTIGAVVLITVAEIAGSRNRVLGSDRLTGRRGV